MRFKAGGVTLQVMNVQDDQSIRKTPENVKDISEQIHEDYMRSINHLLSYTSGIS